MISGAIDSERPRLPDEIQLIQLRPGRWIVRDLGTRRVFELTPEAQILARLLDGHHPWVKLQEEYRKTVGRELSRSDVERLTRELRELRHLPAAAPESSQLQRQTAPPQPLSLLDPGAVTNRFFDLLVLCFGMVISPIGLHVSVIAAVLALWAWYCSFSVFYSELTLFGMRTGVVGFLIRLCAASLFMISLPTALLRGMAARKYGGRIQAFRIKLANGIPVFQCELAPLGFLKPNARMAILACPLVLRLLVFGLAMFAWLTLKKQTLPSDVSLLLILPAIISLLLRGNIFAQGDGYWLLAHGVGNLTLREQALESLGVHVDAYADPELMSLVEAENKPMKTTDGLRAFGLGVILTDLSMHVAVLCVIPYFLINLAKGLGAVLSVLFIVEFYRQSVLEAAMNWKPFVLLLRGGGSFFLRWAVRLGILVAISCCLMLPYPYDIGGNCRTIPNSEQTIRAGIADEIKEILVREGGLVEPNQLIAQLYAREEGAAVEIAKTELAHAVAELDLVKVGPREEQIEIAELRVEMMKYEHQFREKEAKRAQGLFDENAANQSELEDAQRSRDSSETMLKSADDAVQRLRQGSRPESIRASEARVATWKAKLAEAEQMFELREIRSSIAGRVRTPNVELRRGHMVQPGDVICEIQNVDPLRVEVFADEAAVVHVKIGDAVAVRLNGLYGALLKGKVLNIGLLARAESELLEPPSRSDREHQNSEGKSLAPDGRNYVRVVVDFDAAGQQLIPGMTGYARISLRTEPFFKVIWRHVLRFFLVDVWSWLP